jgi:hypothetical protein
MNNTRLFSAARLILLAATLLPAFGQIATDHFKCYAVPSSTPPVANVPVLLQDQFSDGPIQALVQPAIRLCNPTEKTVLDTTPTPEPIVNPNNHLTLYRLQSPEGVLNIPVEVANQFGTKRLLAIAPVALAVPTQKLPHAPPANLDHFKCYSASGEPINIPVRLRDQFQSATHLVGAPALLCNPTRKVHGGLTFGISHPDEHLVCYRITRRPNQMTRQVINQMFAGTQTFAVTFSDMLCVPSKKRIIPSAELGEL